MDHGFVYVSDLGSLFLIFIVLAALHSSCVCCYCIKNGTQERKNKGVAEKGRICREFEPFYDTQVSHLHPYFFHLPLLLFFFCLQRTRFRGLNRNIGQDWQIAVKNVVDIPMCTVDF